MPQLFAEQPAELGLAEGWFGVAATGSRSQAPTLQLASTGPSASSTGGRDQLQRSEFTCQLAEAMYGAVAQALVFLASSAPEAGSPPCSGATFERCMPRCIWGLCNS